VAPDLDTPYRSQRRVGGLTHDVYRYPARLSPDFVAGVIEAFSSPGEVILDPFVGGGTTAVEALASGRRFIGFDVNPVAIALTAGKTTPLRPSLLRALESWAVQDGGGGLTLVPDERTVNTPETLLAWLGPRVASAEGLGNLQLVRAAKVALLDAAQSSLDGRQEPASADSMPASLSKSVARLRSGLLAFERACRQHGLARWEVPRRRILRVGRTEELARLPSLNRAAGRASLLVTSPPYPGVHVLYHRWQVRGRAETPLPYWLTGLHDGLGPKNYTMGSRSAKGEADYFAQSLTAWTNVRRFLKPGAMVVQLVAFARPESQHEKYLAMMAAAGYGHRPDLEPAGWRAVPNRKWYFRVDPTRKHAAEMMLVHEVENASG
jgi:hypothetical protein